MNVLLLSTQLIDKVIVGKIIKKVSSKDTTVKLTLYESPSFYKVNDIPVSNVKKKYFKDCLSNYVKQTPNTTIVSSLTQLTAKLYYYFEFMDDDLEDSLKTIAKSQGISFIRLYNPMFILSSDDRESWIKSHETFTFNVFYKHCRVTHNIFPKPIGGSWVYDDENQQRLPKKLYDELPEVKEITFPTDRQGALKWLKQFVKTKLQMFGPYQDVITDKSIILWHAGISSMLNMGLILPHEVIKLIPSQWPKTHISSYEGFLRQLFWREYMCMVYRAQFPIKNIFKSNVSLDASWYTGAPVITGISLIDTKINQAITQGYLHHIERLMLVGNIMLLLQIKPLDVYTWFMCEFVDAHHWVMVGNVYHMLLWASGRVITQRPYIASSTYLKRQARMSDEDCTLYDKYYMNFILKNQNILKHTYMISGHLKRARTLKKIKKS